MRDEEEDLEEAIEEAIENAVATGAPAPEPPPRFRCRGCGYRSNVFWMGPCPNCHQRFSVLGKEKKDKVDRMRSTLGEAATAEIRDMEHIPTGIQEIDDVLGGGLVLGNLVLLGGKAGSGKSRLCLQIADAFASARRRAFFFSGEDDRPRIVQYARQLGIKNEHIEIYGNPDGLDVVEVTDMIADAGHVKLAIIDSIQMCECSDKKKAEQGNAAQVIGSLNHFFERARAKRIAYIILSQFTKEEDYRLPQACMHAVDALLRFDPWPVLDEEENIFSEAVRKIWIDGKSRQGPTSAETYLEMVEEKVEGRVGRLEPLSLPTRRAMSKLKSI